MKRSSLLSVALLLLVVLVAPLFGEALAGAVCGHGIPASLQSRLIAAVVAVSAAVVLATALPERSFSMLDRSSHTFRPLAPRFALLI